MFELKTLTDYSDEALLAELRRVFSQLRGTQLTVASYDKIARVHSTTLRRRFGSWNNALKSAGLEGPRPPGSVTREAVISEIRKFNSEFPRRSPTLREIAKRLNIHSGTIIRNFGKWSDLLNVAGLEPVPLGRRYSDEECFENIIRLWTHFGRQPNFAELNGPLSQVGSKAYVRRWGGWRAALAAFIKYVNQYPEEATAGEEVLKPSSRNKAIGSTLSRTAQPRSISLALRYRVLIRDRFKCVICGRSPAKDFGIELHVDHLIPWSKGGENTEQNLRTLCFECNLGKGSKIESPS